MSGVDEKQSLYWKQTGGSKHLGVCCLAVRFCSSLVPSFVQKFGRLWGRTRRSSEQCRGWFRASSPFLNRTRTVVSELDGEKLNNFSLSVKFEDESNVTAFLVKISLRLSYGGEQRRSSCHKIKKFQSRLEHVLKTTKPSETPALNVQVQICPNHFQPELQEIRWRLDLLPAEQTKKVMTF